jgi:hypothetical protein
MKWICCTLISFCFSIGALLLADSAVVRQLAGDRLGNEWSVSEGGITGRWVRRGNSGTWDGSWANGAAAILTISIAGDKVRISRKDVGGPSTGLTAIYEGTLAPDGTLQGIETVTSPGQMTQKWQGRVVKGSQPSPPPPPPVGDRLGNEWSVSEAGITGRWVRRGNLETWDGSWANGAAAILTISIAGDKVRIGRKDVGGPSTGLTAIYEGTLAPDGTLQGTETVTSPGQMTQKWQGRIVKGFPPPPPPPPPAGDRLGNEWSVSEAGITGRWVRRGNSETWDGSWANGAAAILTISIAGDKVRIGRKDVGGPSTGLTAIYEGTLAPDGTLQGTETVTSPGQMTQKWQGRIVK